VFLQTGPCCRQHTAFETACAGVQDLPQAIVSAGRPHLAACSTLAVVWEVGRDVWSCVI
jgi:hypothetical protein